MKRPKADVVVTNDERAALGRLTKRVGVPRTISDETGARSVTVPVSTDPGPAVVGKSGLNHPMKSNLEAALHDILSRSQP